MPLITIIKRKKKEKKKKEKNSITSAEIKYGAYKS